MAIRFASFERYKMWMTPQSGKIGSGGIFLAGLGAGVTEAVVVVGPMEGEGEFDELQALSE